MANSVDPDQTVLGPRCLLLYFLFLFLSLNTGTIKLWSLRQGVQFWNFDEKTKTKQKNKTKKKSFGCVCN